MKNTDTKKNDEKKKYLPSNDHTGKELDSDHSGSDCDNDQTETGTKSEKGNRFDKPKREENPDTTGIDVDSDKTKK